MDADDVITLAPTLYALLEIANEFGMQFNVTFNPDKFQLIENFNSSSQSQVQVVFNDRVIESVVSADHLGNLLGNNSSINSVTKSIYDFTYKVNYIMCVFQSASFETKYTLFKSFACVYTVVSCGIIQVNMLINSGYDGENVCANFCVYHITHTMCYYESYVMTNLYRTVRT